MHWLVERVLIGASHKTTIAKYAKGFDLILGLLTIISAALLGLSLTSVVATFDGLYGLYGSYSLIDGLVAIFKVGKMMEASAGFFAFILLPVLNISTAFELWYKYQLQDDKFEKYVRRIKTCRRLWLLSALVAAGFVYLVNSLEQGVLHFPVYYLFFSLILQLFTLNRIGRMVAMVKIV
jgi:hypothetical protein